MAHSAKKAVIDLRSRVEVALRDFLSNEAKYLHGIGDELTPAMSALTSFLLDSGKRLRPLFAAVGYFGAGGNDDDGVLRAVASLELLQACALIHDDLMDASDTRRGKPSIHKQFEALHGDGGWHGSPEDFGRAASVLLGDLALVWSSQMLHRSGIPHSVMSNVLRISDEMRVELMSGQYLDVYEQTRDTHDLARSLKIARYKSGKYTIERPLHFGAALSGAPLDSDIFATYSAFGLPLGEAFQLRDDLLGVFGDPAATGKPAGDDLREGKHTALIAIAVERLTGSDKATFSQLFGNEQLDSNGIEQLRSLIVATGADQEIEQVIETLTSNARTALDDGKIAPTALSLFEELATSATRRSV